MSNSDLVILTTQRPMVIEERTAAQKRKVLLFNLPEISLEPNFPFPPLSLQVLRDRLDEVGGEGECCDLASYGPRIAEQLSVSDFQRLFRANRERGYLTAVDAYDLELTPECLAAVKKTGLIDRVLELVRQSNPVVIGLSIQGTPYSSDLFAVGLCKVLARELRYASSSCAPLVIGGARTVEKDNVRQELMGEPSIDYLVRGNGQRSIRQLTDGLLSDSLDLQEVRGLVYREDKEVRSARECDPPWGHMAVSIWVDRKTIPHYRRALADLSPQARHVPELQGHLEQTICALPFQFTVGCVSECAFCNRASEVGRISKPAEVVDQLEAAVHEYGVREFLFLNSELNFGRTYVHRFCNEITRRKLDIRWIDSCEFRGLDTETLAVMRDAGCVGLWFGLESVSERLLKYIQKRVVVEHAIQMLREADRLGIYNCLNFICGLPYENDDDIETTLSFVRDHHELIDATQVNIFYLQGGPFADTPEKFGLLPRGYEEQVGQTVSKAFDEVFEGGLKWEDKKQQMRSSYKRLRTLNDEYFSPDSHNMLLVMALNRAFGGYKPLMRRALERIGDPALGNFLLSNSQIVRRQGEVFLLDPAQSEVLRVNEVVARCWQLRHLMIWSHIRARLLDEFAEGEVDDALGAIRRMEAEGYFLLAQRNQYPEDAHRV
jgi:radical SAM superfamily enzyme YgiQ (UPF0313 family)